MANSTMKLPVTLTIPIDDDVRTYLDELKDDYSNKVHRNHRPYPFEPKLIVTLQESGECSVTISINGSPKGIPLKLERCLYKDIGGQMLTEWEHEYNLKKLRDKTDAAWSKYEKICNTEGIGQSHDWLVSRVSGERREAETLEDTERRASMAERTYVYRVAK
jgi:hypothetical protein